MNNAILRNKHRNLAGVMIASVFALAACGGGGGGGDHGGGAASSGVALFANNTYVDYQAVPTSSNEGNNEQALLRAQGHTVTPFTGITAAEIGAAVAGKQVLVIPELELGDLNAALDAAARSAIASFVSGGGTLIIHLTNLLPTAPTNLLNAVFGLSLVDINDLGAITRSAGGVVGTPYADCGPATLPSLSSTWALTAASLPANAKVIYQDASGNAVVTLIPVGSGFVVVVGWDLFASKPAGAADSGWWSVMYRAARLSDSLPNVAYLHADGASIFATDVVSKLKSTCQFSSVGAFDAAAATPTLTQLMAFDSVLVSSDNAFANPAALGDVLADYVNAGRGVVLGMFSYWNAFGLGVGGRFQTANYYGIPFGANQTQAIQETGVFAPFAAGHPALAGVAVFNGGTSSYQPATASVVPGVGATLLANWSDATTPLVVTRAVGNARRVDLGFYPASSDAGADLWTSTTDGDKLLANALTWVANRAEPPYQTFTNSTAVAIPDLSTVNSNLIVSGAPTSISKVRVELNITHSFTSDLDIFLEAPDGTMIELTTDNGAGVNFVSTVFDDAAPTSITVGVAPFTGSFIPEVPLANLISRNANGTWVLHVTDDLGADVGTLNSWRLFIR